MTPASHTPRAAASRPDAGIRLGDLRLRSRLILGTGKYATFELMAKALEASGTDCVTVAVRRLDLPAPGTPPQPQSGKLLDHLDRQRYRLLPNTAACRTAEEAMRTARLGRELGLSSLVKLEVIGDSVTLYPDTAETVTATRALVKEGFTVLAYTNDDLVAALRLQDAGAASVMPLGAPIGSGMGLLNPHNIRMIVERLEVPVIVDAGVGTASDVTVAMELGADGVLLNTGVALAQDPVRMAHAVRLACESGRLAYLAGRVPRRPYAGAPSSPEKGKLTE